MYFIISIIMNRDAFYIRGAFSEEFCAYGHTLTYPGDMTDYIAFLKANDKFGRGTSSDVRKNELQR